MLMDDTSDRIYIHNLDAEIRSIEEAEEKLVFLPDIEKKLGKIPRSVLSDVHPSVQGKQMVLYSVPESLSVPKDKDSVRKAIMESRERARDEARRAEQARQREQREAQLKKKTETKGAELGIPIFMATDEDSDKMDIG